MGKHYENKQIKKEDYKKMDHLVRLTKGIGGVVLSVLTLVGVGKYKKWF